MSSVPTTFSHSLSQSWRCYATRTRYLLRFVQTASSTVIISCRYGLRWKRWRQIGMRCGATSGCCELRSSNQSRPAHTRTTRALLASLWHRRHKNFHWVIFVPRPDKDVGVYMQRLARWNQQLGGLPLSWGGGWVDVREFPLHWRCDWVSYGSSDSDDMGMTQLSAGRNLEPSRAVCTYPAVLN